MFAVFPIVQQLPEMLCYLKPAMKLKENQPLHLPLQIIYEKTVELTLQKPQKVIEIDIASHKSEVSNLLIETSKLYRAKVNKKLKGIE